MLASRKGNQSHDSGLVPAWLTMLYAQSPIHNKHDHNIMTAQGCASARRPVQDDVQSCDDLLIAAYSSQPRTLEYCGVTTWAAKCMILIKVSVNSPVSAPASSRNGSHLTRLADLDMLAVAPS